MTNVTILQGALIWPLQFHKIEADVGVVMDDTDIFWCMGMPSIKFTTKCQCKGDIDVNVITVKTRLISISLNIIALNFFKLIRYVYV